MKLSQKIMHFLLAVFMTAFLIPSAVSKAENMYENSDFIETEQPELNEETKQLISQYPNNPTEENYPNLRDIVIENYNAVLDKKEAKLDELAVETSGNPGGNEILAEMEEIVQEMYITYWSRINSSMLRFTDTRLLKWRISESAQHEYIPFMGAGENIYVKRTPVTNAEYAEFITATGAQAPSNWTNGTYSKGEDDYPVNFVSYDDAESYCAWLTEQDDMNTYLLPNESEWELAAGHMPKDADFNCGVNDGRTPVDQYSDVTRSSHGAVDFWGNVWEWTSTLRSDSGGVTVYGVKGGSCKSDRTNCRTEYLDEGRDGWTGYNDAGFRVIQVKDGVEPEQKVELATLLYQGQASIRIVTAEGKVIYIDPYAGSGYDLPADLILVTHEHFDHNDLDKIETRNPDCVVITHNKAIQNGEHQTFDFGYVNIEAVEAGYNEDHDASECVGYVLTFSNGKSVYVSGDTSTTPQMSEMSEMQIDYAFYCCDGVFNMGLEEAARCAETVGTKHNIPYHMTGRTPKTYDREIAEQFQSPNRLIIDQGEEIKII